MNNPSSILIVKTSAIGDIVQTFPVVEYLARRFPDAEIDWVVEKGSYDLVASHPLIRNTFMVDTKKWRRELTPTSAKQFKEFRKQIRKKKYDVLFDLQGNTKSGMVTFLARAKHKVGFAKSSVAEFPNLFATTVRFSVKKEQNVRLRYLELVQQFFHDTEPFSPEGVHLKLTSTEEAKREETLALLAGKRPLFMVCFGSKWQNKMLDQTTLTLFLEKLKFLNPSFLFIFGNAEEQSQAGELTSKFPGSFSVGNLTLPLWQALMHEVNAMIAVDSAGLHLCGTTSTPSFSVFGPSSASVYKPLGDKHTSVQGPCPYGKSFTSRCPILRSCKTAACIKSLTAESLLQEFCAFWEKTAQNAHSFQEIFLY